MQELRNSIPPRPHSDPPDSIVVFRPERLFPPTLSSKGIGNDHVTDHAFFSRYLNIDVLGVRSSRSAGHLMLHYQNLLHLNAILMLRYLNFSCTCTNLMVRYLFFSCPCTPPCFYFFSCNCKQAWCYIIRSSLAFAHRFAATLSNLLLHLHTDLMLHYQIFSCTCSPTWCYVIKSSLALAHRLDATLSNLLFHVHTDLMLRYPIFSCTCTPTRC